MPPRIGCNGRLGLECATVDLPAHYQDDQTGDKPRPMGRLNRTGLARERLLVRRT